MIVAEHKIRMARLALIDRRLAELAGEGARLMAERARIFSSMADGEAVDLTTGRRRRPAPEPELPPISELDMARADSALRQNDVRRRVGR